MGARPNSWSKSQSINRCHGATSSKREENSRLAQSLVDMTSFVAKQSLKPSVGSGAIENEKG
jgi:hypothetical protein